jgi:sec-independent protein translocase protein TatA
MTLNFVLNFLNLGGPEVFIIVLVILLLFGAKRIPDLAKGVGKGVREFKDAMSGVQNEIKDSINDVKKDTQVKDTQL